MAGLKEKKKGSAKADAQNEQELVTCILDEVEFGLDINAVQEIVRIPRITPVPHAPAYVRGVANLRGSVLPIVSSRTRFGMPHNDDEENSRVVVVELNGASTGFIVDAVKEVMSVKSRDVEPAPPTVHGIDSRFLSGIVKLADGKRLVMMLDHNNIIDAGDIPSVATAQTEQHATSSRATEADKGGNEDDHEQLVTFRLADEEFGITIMDVQEIIRVPEITRVPHAPSGVLGVTSLRNRVLPVMDLRTKFGQPTLAVETASMLEKFEHLHEQHRHWYEELRACEKTGGPFKGSLDAAQCTLGKWLATFSTRDIVVKELMAPLAAAHERLHMHAKSYLILAKSGDAEGAHKLLEGDIRQAWDELSGLFNKLTKGISEREDERCLVVTIGNSDLALRIDAVNEVLQVPKSAVEKTPKIVSGSGATKEQIHGVAKLQDGKRLIMFLNVHRLISELEIKAIAAEGATSSRAQDDKGHGAMGTVTEGDERQLVSFRVADEEFATDIMQVQEIIRLDRVTKVPHAPAFVEGVVNLRGNVLPVIDLRCRFGLPSHDHSDATRVVVVDIRGRKTGIIVDSVSEVMRLSNNNIEAAPPIVAGHGGEEFIEGVGKIANGERMVLLLRADKLLSDDEAASLAEIERTATKDESGS